MATKFFKKFAPEIGVDIGGSRVMKFPTLDGIIGWFSTDDEGLQAVLQGHINNRRYGLSETTWDEFNDSYLKKKANATPLRKPWRDEISLSGRFHAQASNPDAKAVAVVSERNGVARDCSRLAMVEGGEPSEQAVKAVAEVAAALKVPFTPPVGKREPRP